MTNGIRADVSSEMVHLTSYPPQNPNFYHSNQYPYTPFPNPDSYPSYQYLPPPAPPYTYYSPQPPPQPSYQLYTTTHIPDTSTHLSFTDGLSGYFTYQAEFQPPLTSHSYNTQPISSGYMSSTITAQHYQQEAIFVQQPNTYAPQMFDEITDSHMPVSNAIIDNRHKIEEKLTEMLHTLEKMGKNLAESSKILKGISSTPVSQPSHMLNRASNINNLDTSGLVKETLDVESDDSNDLQLPQLDVPVLRMFDEIPEKEFVDDKSRDGTFEGCEDLKQLQVLTPANYVPEVFVASPETNSTVFPVERNKELMNIDFVYPITSYDKILIYKLYENECGKAHGEFYVNFKNMVNATQLFDLSPGTKCDRFKFYKLREDERGKVEVLAESREHICESELLEKGKFNVSLKFFDGDGSLCKPVCLDSMSSQIDGVPRKELVNRNVFIPYAIKEFMFKESFNWFYCKSRNDVECFTTPTQLVAYNRCLALLKDREIRACLPKYGLLVKLIIANVFTCFYLKHEIENSAMDLFEILPLNDVITWIELRIACVAIRFLYQVVRCFNWMAERKPDTYKPLFAEFCQYGRASLPLKFFSTMVGKVAIFSVSSIVNACELLPETPISETIQKIAIKVVLGSEECIESAIFKLYSGSGQLEYATSFYKKVLVGLHFQQGMILISGYHDNTLDTSLLAFYSLNSSLPTYQSISLKMDFFNAYLIFDGAQIQCSVLFKAIYSVLRMPIASIDHLRVYLPCPEASKIQWTLDRNKSLKKAYWIACKVEPVKQHLSLDRRTLLSSFVVKPRDLNKLLANFQSILQETTFFATEPTSMPAEAASEIMGKVVERGSYINPNKGNDSSLHTQQWIDPSEEFLQYNHTGNPVNVTFGVKELRGCEVDIHLYFEKVGELILMAPKFGLDDGSTSILHATLVIAIMLVFQQQEKTDTGAPPAVATTNDESNRVRSLLQEKIRENVSEHPSDHTRIWSKFSSSGIGCGTSPEQRDVHTKCNPNTNQQQEIHKLHVDRAGTDKEIFRMTELKLMLLIFHYTILVTGLMLRMRYVVKGTGKVSVEAKYKISPSYILEDKDDLKERNMSQFQLSCNVGPDIRIEPNIVWLIGFGFGLIV